MRCFVFTFFTSQSKYLPVRIIIDKGSSSDTLESAYVRCFASLVRAVSIAWGRELRMIELKKEINELCERVGLAARYSLEAERDSKKIHG